MSIEVDTQYTDSIGRLEYVILCSSWFSWVLECSSWLYCVLAGSSVYQVLLGSPWFSSVHLNQVLTRSSGDVVDELGAPAFQSHHLLLKEFLLVLQVRDQAVSLQDTNTQI